VRAEVTYGAPGVGDVPVTTAELRLSDGSSRVVRIVGGPRREGAGVVRLAGYVVPRAGAVVRVDLAEEPGAPWAPRNAWTTNTPPGPWPSSALPVPFTLALGPSGSASRDLGTTDAAAEVDVALRTWTLVVCTAWRSRFAGTASLAPGDDGVDGVFWHDDAWPPELVAGALGQTVLSTDASGHYVDADVHLNGADYTFSLDGHGDTVDARSVLTHELGHALGLGHSTVPGATMDASLPAGIAARSLEQDDRDGVCAIYPGSGAAGCEAGPPCPSGFACVARYCERYGTRGETCAPCQRLPGACAGSGDDARCIDIGGGATAGRVCGRACAVDADCGPRFRCLPTTTSGDLQCVSDDGCASGPDPCSSDAQCGGDSVCRGGACVGAVAGEDAGAADGDGGADGAGGPNGAASEVTAGGGCTLGGGRARAGWALLAAAGVAATLGRRRSRQ